MSPEQFDKLLDDRAERQRQQAARDEAAATERWERQKIAEKEQREARRRLAAPPTLAYAIASADRNGRDEAITIAVCSLLGGEVAHDIVSVAGRGFARSSLGDAAAALASTLPPGLARSQLVVTRQCGASLPEEARCRVILALVGMVHDLRAELASRASPPMSANLSIDTIDDLLGGQS